MIGWLAKSMPERLGEVFQKLEKSFQIQRLFTLDELNSWAEKNPGSMLIIRTPIQYTAEAQECIRRYGLKTMNTLSFLEKVQNRRILTEALQKADIPTPDSAPSEHTQGFIIKPISPSRHEFWRSEIDEAPEEFLTQPWIPNSGIDFKVYVAGENVWAFRRPSTFKGRVDKIKQTTPAPLDPELKELAEQLKSALGGAIFGFDLVRSEPGKLFVVDVNSFPGMGRFSGGTEAIHEILSTWIGAEQARVNFKGAISAPSREGQRGLT